MNENAHMAAEAYDLVAGRYHELFHNEMREKEYDRNLLDGLASRFKAGSLLLDAGCGPSAHIGRYVADKGLAVAGVDISERCITLARQYNPAMAFLQADIAGLPFRPASFEGVISYYSIMHTPKSVLLCTFREFARVLKRGGLLLIAVKAGAHDAIDTELLGVRTEIHVSLFSLQEIRAWFVEAGFALEFIEMRNPYDFEINNDRIFAIGRKL